MRVIQDSDDEFDDLEANESPPKQAAPPNHQLAPSQSGTGSTESLKRAIRAAHHDCLQSQDSHNEVHSPGHVLGLPDKRRKTSAQNIPVVGLIEIPLENDLVSPEVGWNLEDTIHVNYATHDPMAMFPEPSSTIPNATFTQERLMGNIMPPIMLGEELDHEAPCSNLRLEPSVPWSDLIKFSPPSPVEQAGSSNRGHTPGALPASSNRHGTTQQQVLEAHHASPQTQEMVERTPSSRKRQNIPELDSEDELADFGLPKEQYKPRPSRSRSLRASIEESIDYPIRPEKAARASRRRSAKNASHNESTPTTPQKIQRICAMGFTPSTTERALTQNSGDITQTVDWLLNNGIGEDELASQGPHNKKMRTRDNSAHANATVESDKIQCVVDEPAGLQSHVVSVPTLPSSTLQVVIRQTPPKRRKTTLDEPDSEPLLSLRDEVVPVGISAKKRGRGRPKKAVPIAEATEALADAPDGKVPTEVGGVASEVVPLESTKLILKPSPPHEPQNQEDGASAKAPPLIVPAKDPSRSATNRKVPYRVGLSKRARIAPLLRTLKK